MYKLYSFHLLNNPRPSYNLKISPEIVEPARHPSKTNINRSNSLQTSSRNFLSSIIMNATAGKSCSSCGGGGR